MASRSHTNCSGGGKAGRGHGIHLVLARIHGCVKIGGSACVGKVDGSGKKLCTCRGRIDGQGCRINPVGFHINSDGQLYVPDSEAEGADVEVDDVVVEGASGVVMPVVGGPAVVVLMDEAAAMTGPPAMAPIDELVAEGAPSVELATDAAPVKELAADGALGEELSLEVQARLEVVLAAIDPADHAFFIDMYKVMVPTLFKSD
ncbi:unnamed protein product [Urochloa humidicola]